MQVTQNHDSARSATFMRNVNSRTSNTRVGGLFTNRLCVSARRGRTTYLLLLFTRQPPTYGHQLITMNVEDFKVGYTLAMCYLAKYILNKIYIIHLLIYTIMIWYKRNLNSIMSNVLFMFLKFNIINKSIRQLHKSNRSIGNFKGYFY